MDFFQTLEKEQCPTPFQREEEMKFFLRYSGVLTDFPAYKRFANASKPFDIIRANIIIRALHNKYMIEKEFSKALKAERENNEDPLAKAIERTEAAIKNLPYCQEGNHRIYVPIFPRSLNSIYDGQFPKLLEGNYKQILETFEPLCVDPFDIYGNGLYNSYFTKLVLVAENDKLKAFYDYDAFRIYIVNEQGRLENEICLFDRGIHRRNTSHMTERIKPVIEAYFNFDKEAMIKALVDNKLISSSLLYKIISKETKLYQRMERHSR